MGNKMLCIIKIRVGIYKIKIKELINLIDFVITFFFKFYYYIQRFEFFKFCMDCHMISISVSKVFSITPKLI